MPRTILLSYDQIYWRSLRPNPNGDPATAITSDSCGEMYMDPLFEDDPSSYPGGAADALSDMPWLDPAELSPASFQQGPGTSPRPVSVWDHYACSSPPPKARLIDDDTKYIPSRYNQSLPIPIPGRGRPSESPARAMSSIVSDDGMASVTYVHGKYLCLRFPGIHWHT